MSCAQNFSCVVFLLYCIVVVNPKAYRRKKRLWPKVLDYNRPWVGSTPENFKGKVHDKRWEIDCNLKGKKMTSMSSQPQAFVQDKYELKKVVVVVDCGNGSSF